MRPLAFCLSPYLLKAKEETKKRMKDNPSPENIGAFKKAREAVAAETERIPRLQGLRRVDQRYSDDRRVAANPADAGSEIVKFADFILS
jgi:hypothetical protein